LNCNEDLVQTLLDLIQVQCDSFFLRFNSRDTRFEQKSWSHGWHWILILITHYSVRSYPQMYGFTHHWCMSTIIRSLLLSGGGFERRDQCTYKRCSENENSYGYHWLEPIKLKYVLLFAKAFLLFRDCKFDLRFGVWGFKILVWDSIQDLRFCMKIWISSQSSEEDLSF